MAAVSKRRRAAAATAPARGAPTTRPAARAAAPGPAPASPAAADPGRAPASRAGLAGADARPLVPLAVGRTAAAVSDLADSGLLLRLTRGRLWIGMLTTLLVGIVALNVLALSFSATASSSARRPTP